MRKKYYWLAGDWKLVLERCERKILLGWRLLELPNRMKMKRSFYSLDSLTLVGGGAGASGVCGPSFGEVSIRPSSRIIFRI